MCTDINQHVVSASNQQVLEREEVLSFNDLL